MMRFLSLSILLVFIWGTTYAQSADFPSIRSFTSAFEKADGLFPTYWDGSRMYVEVSSLEKEFLYINSLATGVGSNDIGLDRGQLGRERIVFFRKVGQRLLLIQPNYDYRAVSDNPDEVLAVEEAFAQSVLGTFSIEAASADRERFLIDMTSFLMQDAHGVAQRLDQTGQGKYNLDRGRCAFHLPRTKNFPKNSEFEVLLTFAGKPKGGYVRSVVPSPEAVSVRQHHSFVELPDDSYAPRMFDPRAGYFPLSFQDYATPIDQPLVRRFIQRHRIGEKGPVRC